MKNLRMIRLGVFTLGAAAACLVYQSSPVSALICANEPSRTTFVGGPGTDACSSIKDLDTCLKSFHRSGVLHLAKLPHP